MDFNDVTEHWGGYVILQSKSLFCADLGTSNTHTHTHFSAPLIHICLPEKYCIGRI